MYQKNKNGQSDGNGDTSSRAEDKNPLSESVLANLRSILSEGRFGGDSLYPKVRELNLPLATLIDALRQIASEENSGFFIERSLVRVAGHVCDAVTNSGDTSVFPNLIALLGTPGFPVGKWAPNYVAEALQSAPRTMIKDVETFLRSDRDLKSKQTLVDRLFAQGGETREAREAYTAVHKRLCSLFHDDSLVQFRGEFALAIMHDLDVERQLVRNVFDGFEFTVAGLGACLEHEIGSPAVLRAIGENKAEASCLLPKLKVALNSSHWDTLDVCRAIEKVDGSALRPEIQQKLILNLESESYKRRMETLSLFRSEELGLAMPHIVAVLERASDSEKGLERDHEMETRHLLRLLGERGQSLMSDPIQADKIVGIVLAISKKECVFQDQADSFAPFIEILGLATDNTEARRALYELLNGGCPIPYRAAAAAALYGRDPTPAESVVKELRAALADVDNDEEFELMEAVKILGRAAAPLLPSVVENFDLIEAPRQSHYRDVKYHLLCRYSFDSLAHDILAVIPPRQAMQEIEPIVSRIRAVATDDSEELIWTAQLSTRILVDVAVGYVRNGLGGAVEFARQIDRVLEAAIDREIAEINGDKHRSHDFLDELRDAQYILRIGRGRPLI